MLLRHRKWPSPIRHLTLLLWPLLTYSPLLSLVKTASGLVIKSITVPNFTQVGESCSLRCHYDLEGEFLYSIKWYKDNQEFYRYVPKVGLGGQMFPVAGVDVRLELSDQEWVHLHNISLLTAGLFTCEVSTEAPRFRTAAHTKDMKVILPPASGPYLEGPRDGEGFRVGEMLDLNCSSPASHPPTLLKFYLNDEPANEKHVEKFDMLKAKDGLTPSMSSYTLRIKRNHFKHGVLTVKCTADIFKTYYKSVERTFIGVDLGEKALGSLAVNSVSTGLDLEKLLLVLVLFL